MAFKDKEIEKEYKRKWHQENKEKNRNKRAAYKKEWELKNKDKISEYNKKQNLKNKDKISKYNKKYRIENLEKVKLLDKNRDKEVRRLGSIKRTEKLSNGYINQILAQQGFPKESITPELIEVKRIILKTKRL